MIAKGSWKEEEAKNAEGDEEDTSVFVRKKKE